MKKAVKYISVAGVITTLSSIVWGTQAKENPFLHHALIEKITNYIQPDTTEPVTLPYPFKDESVQDPLNYPNSGGLKLENPSNIKTNVEYDPSNNQYNISQKMGGLNYRPEFYMDAEEYSDYELNKAVKNYWRQRSHAESQTEKKSVLAPKLQVGGEVFDRIFGGNTIDIRPQGSAELSFGVNTSRNQNPAIPERQRKISTFDFNQRIQLNVVGKIGDKLKLTTNYNTEAQFDFENQMKLEYTGYEDEIIKKIEAGNVSLPLTGSLITGSQSLFGVKTQLQFGRLTATSILSQARGRKSEVEVSGGAQTSNFDINGDSYDAFKHYFLAHSFRNNYDQAMTSLPIINSNIMITKIEVWVTNKNGSQTDVRNILALSDLGETDPNVIKTPGVNVFAINDLNPTNTSNSLDPATLNNFYPGVRSINSVVPVLSAAGLNENDFMKVEQARKLTSSEYTFNPRLGFISLNQNLTDEVLGVSFQYNVVGSSQIYQVGELSTDGINTDSLLVVKMLKNPITNPKLPMWDLMMKNIYNIGAYQVNPQDFKLNIIYANPATGTSINFLPVDVNETNIYGKPLLQVVSLDKLNVLGDAKPDGVFDFLDGITIGATNGRVIFPVLEPFGAFLQSRFLDQTAGAKFAFPQLYDSTRTIAQQFPDKNRFKLKGSYKSSSTSEISLNAANVPQGSVTVTAGGIALQENIDYTVDYALGRVKIINQGILNSGTPIKISLESNSLFTIQSKTLLGTHLDYRISKDFSLGGTILNLTERPLTRKVNIGDEPISNTIWGIDGNYRTEAPFLTRWIDKLPLISTKEMSTIAVNGEFAQLIPGHSKAIGKEGNSYIDDFEGSQTSIDIRQPQSWSLASTPQNQSNLFPEGSLSNNLASGYKRAKLNWFFIDPLFQRQTANLTPGYYDNAKMSNHFTREILETEVFPNKQPPSGQIPPIQVLNLAYYPFERGPYNYDTLLNANGTLQNPKSRWAGIMRRIETNDFEAANIDFIQFWMMDPFNSDNTFGSTTGDLYLNLGNISEDVLRDSRRTYENGYPVDQNLTNIDTTVWGRVPIVQPVNKNFALEGREYQDIGLDGLRDVEEQSFFQNYINKIAAKYGASSGAYTSVYNDPSADNYTYYRNDQYDNNSVLTLDRYKKFNGLEGNSATDEQSNAINSSGYPTAATVIPNEEDINRDNTLNEIESYYQYRVSLKPQDFQTVGKNYITNTFSTTANTLAGPKNITWYQFKIPIKSFESKIGNIEDFRSIRFMRMFLKGVDTTIVLRFARLELVRSEWRRYEFSLLQPGEYPNPDDANTQFNLAAINIEENGKRTPVNYVLPPGIERQTNIQSVAQTLLNEQAISATVCDLKDGDSRAIFKNTDIDVRSYKRLKMFVHAEAGPNNETLKDNELTAFIRLGTDYTDNYYEYEIPLKITPAGFYTPSNEDQQRLVWPDENTMDLAFESLQTAKQKRNIALLNNNTISIQTPYTVYDENSIGGKNKITIVGNPNLSTIKVIMLGVRNPKKQNGSNDDGLDKCTEVWFNELRLTDFDQNKGWAANARINAKLADLGNVALAGSYSTPGFGSIEKRVSERSRETVKQYDLSSNIELSKFLPEKLGIKIPVYFGFSEAIRTPQFNPLDPDILLKPTLLALPKEFRDSISNVTQDYTKRKSINFTNVHKEKAKGKKAHIYDVENISLTYSYSELFKRNVNIEYSTLKTYRGALTYNYSATPKNIKPFAKAKIFKSKYFALIKDFNFYPAPNKYGFSTDINRSYSEVKNRDITSSEINIETLFNKTFTWTRAYDLKYDISKSLKFDFTANNDARIFEPDGRIDTDAKRDTVRRNIRNLGTTTSYRHNTNISYTIPINKIPLFDFATASVRYASTYSWTRALFSADSLGNTIQNTNSKQWNGRLSMTTLYNKIPYLKRLAQSAPARSNDNKFDKNKATAAKDSTKTKEKKPQPIKLNPIDHIVRLIISLKDVSINYSNTSGIVLPGFADSTRVLGMNPKSEAPGWGFLFGDQKDIRPEAESRGWLLKNPNLNIPYSNTNAKNLSLQGNVEPFKDFKIQLTANRNYSTNYSEFFRWNETQDLFVHETPTLSGNFSMSYITIRSAFKKLDKNNKSEVFEDFLNYRADVSSLRAQDYNNATGVLLNQKQDGFIDGYGSLSQEVLIPAFLAAYSGKRPNNSHLNAFPKTPLPNWRVTYDGLMKLERVKKYFKTFTLSHAYRSTYNVSSFTNNLNHVDIGKGYTYVRESSGDNNFVSPLLITAVSISEQFSPLIKADVTWNNSLLSNIEIKKDRTISLTTAGTQQITEVSGREIVVGSGYRIREVEIKRFKIKGKPIKSDLNIKADVSYRINKTVIHRIVDKTNQAQAGQNVISIKTSADYVISDKLNIRLFYDRVINTPVVPATFPSSNTNAGVSIRFTLSQ